MVETKVSCERRKPERKSSLTGRITGEEDFCEAKSAQVSRSHAWTAPEETLKLKKDWWT
jgi:hypothetical protein